ncbi:efflux RND transporter periplasmic adaptor subunit [Clostridium butyricum]
MKNKILSILLILSLSTFFTSCSPFTKEDIANVTLTKVKSSDSISDTVYTSNIESQDDISVFPSSPGKVQSINFELGQEVKKDDVLFVLDNTELTYKLNAAKANYDSASASYDKVASGSAKQAQIDAEKALEAAQNELKDAQKAYDIAKDQYSNNTNITSAQTAYDSAKLNYDRTNTLYTAGGASEVDLEAAQDKLTTAKAALDLAKDNTSMALSTAETRLSNANASYNSASANATITSSITNPDNITSAKASMDSAKASLDLAQYSFDNAVIKAPVDGKISAKNISVGEYTSTQTPSCIITNENTLKTTIKVTETNIQNIKEGLDANIYIPSSGASYSGTVYAISPSADTSTGMFDVKINITNPDENLKVGMVANVTFNANNENESVLVPSQCVFNKDSDSPYVYIINGDRLSKKSVTVSENQNDYIVITDGLTTDDEVVLQGSSNLSDNVKYNIVKTN